MQSRPATVRCARNLRKHQRRNALRVRAGDLAADRARANPHASPRRNHASIPPSCSGAGAVVCAVLSALRPVCSPLRTSSFAKAPADESDSTAFGSNAVVIENAMNPDAAHFAQGTIGENGGVFDRNVSLIIETICDPTAQCFRRKLAFIHRDMEWMFVVIRARTDFAQIFHESFAVPKPSGHKVISNPSRAISIPACSTCAAFSSSRHQDRVRVVYVGVNLPARRRSAQQIKTAVADGQMIHLTRSAAPGRTTPSSPSVQNVPSNRTTSDA